MYFDYVDYCVTVDSNMANSKISDIYCCTSFRHPLFPLLALLFERCEQATQSAETPNSESFNLDIQAFVQHQERDRKPFLINDSEVDGLVRQFSLNKIVQYVSVVYL